MFFGLLLSRIGTSMIWPYLMIYVSEKVDLPLAAVATLLSINALSGLLLLSSPGRSSTASAASG